LEKGAEFLRSELVSMGPWTKMEKRALFLMLLAIGLWMTDLIHHISPAVIGIGIGLFACVPAVGVLNQEDMKRLNYLPVFFVATAISMGTVLVQTGALHAMTAIMFDWMRPLMAGNIYALAVVPYWTAFVYHIFLGNEIGMLATSMPGLMSFARSNGIHPLPLGLIWAFAAGGKIFVYQSGVLVAGYSYGYFKAKDVFRVGLCVTVIESLVLLLIVPFYWPLLGIR
jgi:di/tricarboxylate transporter